MPRNLGFSDGSSMSIDRTREAGVKTLGFADGSSIVANRTASPKIGVKEPLLSKVVGGAMLAYSFRDLNSKQGDSNIANIRRSSDNLEKIFKAKDVPTIEDWTNGKLETTLPADVDTAAAAYSLRKVKASYGIPTTVVNGTDGFPTTITTSEQSITGTSFTVRHFSNNSPDSSEATAVDGVYRVSATKTSSASFAKAIRIRGLEDGKQYAVKGEFRMVADTTSGGDSVALVDISDNSPDTDEDSISTASTTFVPFLIDAGYNSGSGDNFIDFTVVTVGSETGTITAEFRNVEIIENQNSAVRIRRSSDDEEVVVGFDSNNKVSASSPVTATPSGSTTATTLDGFLNQTTNITATGNFGNKNNSSVRVTSTEFSATSLDFTVSALENNSGASTTDAWILKSENHNKPSIGEVKFSFDVTHFNKSSGNFNMQPFVDANGNGSAGYNSLISIDSTGSYSFTQTLATTQTSTAFRFFGTNMAVGDRIRIENFKVEALKTAALVHTWYDQAGSNNAVQETAANQPKIAENGALLTDGLDFDGSASFLDATFALGATSTIGIFSVIKPDSTDNDGFILDNRDANDDGARLMQSEAGVGKYLFSMDSTDISLPDEGVKTTETLVTAIQSSTAATLFKNAAQVATAADDAISVTSAYRIGANRVTAGITFFDGTMKEIILFTSDQSANRFKIESNINNYYGLYNDELNFTSVVSPGTLPTAITTSDGTVEIGSTSQPITTNSKNSIKYNYNSGSYGTGNIFTRYMLDSGSDFIGLAQGDTIQVSLFVEELTSGVTLKLILNDNYTALSDESDISSVGFHSLTLTRNSTSGTEDNLQFKSLGLAGAVNISIKDIKVSRIARNGFVETWYDQSGGGFNMTQEQESLQPYRIQNGGTHDGLFAPRNTATSGNKVHMESLFRNQNFPANTTKLCYIVVGENFSANGSGNNKGTIFGAHRGVGNYIEGQHGLVVIATNKFGWQHGVTSNANDYQYIDLTTSGDNALETNKVLLIASINNTTGTISSNTQSSTATLTRNTGAAPADLSLAFGTATDSNLKYIRLFAPNRDNSFRAHNYAYGTIKEAILYANDHGNNLPAIKANINNHYQIYS